jgi:hypothetical protein
MTNFQFRLNALVAACRAAAASTFAATATVDEAVKAGS